MRVPLLLLFLATAGFAAELQLDSAAVAADKPAALSLHLQSGDSELTSVQFDVEYDASQYEVTVEIGAAAEKAVKVLQTNTLQPGKQRVLIFGFNRNKIADGVIAVAHVSLKGTAGTGQGDPVRISKPVGTNGAGEAVPVTLTVRTTSLAIMAPEC